MMLDSLRTIQEVSFGGACMHNASKKASSIFLAPLEQYDLLLWPQLQSRKQSPFVCAENADWIIYQAHTAFTALALKWPILHLTVTATHAAHVYWRPRFYLTTDSCWYHPNAPSLFSCNPAMLEDSQGPDASMLLTPGLLCTVPHRPDPVQERRFWPGHNCHPGGTQPERARPGGC